MKTKINNYVIDYNDETDYAVISTLDDDGFADSRLGIEYNVLIRLVGKLIIKKYESDDCHEI